MQECISEGKLATNMTAVARDKLHVIQLEMCHSSIIAIDPFQPKEFI